ncbi:MAG: hypothetical protein JXJ04_22600, partial [Spirochaetales bacterium]|nr:hypothetical protein [Spirochaetales bacterium]
MNNNKRKWPVFLIVFLLLAGGVSVYAEGTAEAGLLPFNARLASMGGFHPALTDDTMTIFTNPAGFRSIESEILISEVTLSLTGPIFNITSAFISGGDLDENIDLLSEITGIYSRMELLGPVSFAFVGQGLAVGFFNWTDVAFDSKGSLSMSSTVMSNVLITGGYAFRFLLPGDNTIDLGVQLKALVRGAANSDSTAIELLYKAFDDPLNLLYMGEFVLSIGGGI